MFDWTQFEASDTASFCEAVFLGEEPGMLLSPSAETIEVGGLKSFVLSMILDTFLQTFNCFSQLEAH